ncbi:hypothetical protein KM043_013692 [Ampulex compressa]|nr:hypothetical protein KM043_013692 [Ampulex compressa]
MNYPILTSAIFPSKFTYQSTANFLTHSSHADPTNQNPNTSTQTTKKSELPKPISQYADPTNQNPNTSTQTTKKSELPKPISQYVDPTNKNPNTSARSVEKPELPSRASDQRDRSRCPEESSPYLRVTVVARERAEDVFQGSREEIRGGIGGGCCEPDAAGATVRWDRWRDRRGPITQRFYAPAPAPPRGLRRRNHNAEPERRADYLRDYRQGPAFPLGPWKCFYRYPRCTTIDDLRRHTAR